MNTQQQGLITLIKSGLTGQGYSLPADFTLDGAQTILKKHHITSLVYLGACNCGIPKQLPMMQELFAHYCKATMKSEAQLRAVRKIFAAFDEQGIHYMPLKGSRIKALYPAPELRYMGDADILIRLEQYPKIKAIMQNLGFMEGKESDHELVWNSKALQVELHKRLIPSYNQDLAPYFGDGWSRAKPEAGTRHVMRAEDEWIFLFTHFAKHYRDGGIGCRYVADLWLFRKAHPQMDEAYVRRELAHLQLLEFYENVLRLIRVWFEEESTDVKMDYMTDFIFASGSWGATDSRVLSAAVKDTQHSGGQGARGKYIWKTLFPPADMLDQKYTVLQRHRWLLPAVWVYRPFYKVLFERNTLVKQQKNLETLTQDNIALHKKMLEYVGLEYRF